MADRRIRASTSWCRRWPANWSIPTAAAQIREMVRQTTNERQSANGRISMTDGRNFQFAAVPLPDGNALFTMVDVTDSSRIEAALRERAAALEEADRVKTDFVANMSYELRTPLTSIGGFGELLAGGYAGELSAKGQDYVDAILESVERLSKLINDVLDLTTGDTRGVALERERVDVAGLCRAAVETARSARGGKGAEARSRDRSVGGLRVRRRAAAARVDRARAPERDRLQRPQGPDCAQGRGRRASGGHPHQRQWVGNRRPRTCRAYSTASTGWSRRACAARRRSGSDCR